MKNKKFIELYKSLPRVNRIRHNTRLQIIKECGITRTIFYNWVSGVTSIDDHSKPIIAKILNTSESELFTNEK